jgi:Na+/H+ antiporter NhaD/arsenite permease-like protein
LERHSREGGKIGEWAMSDFTSSWFGILALAIFICAYVLVVLEETISLRKSKPVLLAAGLIWILVGLAFASLGKQTDASAAASHVIESYGELFIFLLVSITYVNVLEERRVFDALRVRLSSLGVSYRELFWLLGIATFFMSAFLANMTTALIMGAVVLALGRGAEKFIALTCISIVVASNAGGAFSPFGDTTTLMIWQKGKLGFYEFFVLFVPSFINWLIPAGLMHYAVPSGKPVASADIIKIKPGSIGVILLFAVTLSITVYFQTVLGLQPALGMMLGFGLLQFWAYYLNRMGSRRSNADMVLNSFKEIERVEWDTLLFFLGVMFAVAGLGALGWLTLLNQTLYGGLGPTIANTMIGVLSAVLDNIPLVFAVLTMDPQMSDAQWLLVALTAGVGGSLLSIGSAAGVALMGIAQGRYTFMSHLKWTWAVALGYAASVVVHLILNKAAF